MENQNKYEGSSYRFSLEQFDTMNDLGFFNDVRVELLDGEIFIQPRASYREANAIRFLNHQLSSRLSNKIYVSPRLPVVLTALPRDYVEPDLALLKLPEEQYDTRDVTSNDVLLVIEVSDSTLVRDQGKKLAACARNRIPHVWIHNLITDKIETYSNSDGQEYLSKQVLTFEELDIATLVTRLEL
jgi:Uma2 family endonuclease